MEKQIRIKSGRTAVVMNVNLMIESEDNPLNYKENKIVIKW